MAKRRVKIKHGREFYKQRNEIERFFGRLKLNRAIATRYDQLAESFLSMLHIATARFWVKFAHAAWKSIQRIARYHMVDSFNLYART